MTRTLDETAHKLYSQLIGWPGPRRVCGLEVDDLLRLVVRSLVTCPRCHGPVGEARNECMTCANLSSWKRAIESSDDA